jgi:L-fuconolactonase
MPFPKARIVLDHVGAPIGIGPYVQRRDEVFQSWRTKIRQVAECPNVLVKIGGFGMRLFGFDFHAQATAPSSQAIAAALRPYVETTIEAFGPSRCMFESNFPVDKGSFSYVALWNAFKRLAADLSEEEKDLLFSGTAGRFYRLPVGDSRRAGQGLS